MKFEQKFKLYLPKEFNSKIYREALKAQALHPMKVVQIPDMPFTSDMNLSIWFPYLSELQFSHL